MIYAICIILPPLALLLTGHLFAAILNIPLCVLGWLPAVVHAWATVSEDRRRYQVKQEQNAQLKLQRLQHRHEKKLAKN